MIDVQDQLLRRLKSEETFVVVIVQTGQQLKGIVREFDRETVLLESDGQQHYIQRTAVVTYTPAQKKF